MYHRKDPPQRKRLVSSRREAFGRSVFKDALKDIAAAIKQSDSPARPRPSPVVSADVEELRRERRREIEAAIDIALRETDQHPVFRLSYEKELVRLVMRGEAEPDTALMSLFGLFDDS